MDDFRKYALDYVRELGRHGWEVMTAIVLANLELARFIFPDVEGYIPGALTKYGPALLIAFIGFRIYCELRRQTGEKAVRNVSLQDGAFYAFRGRWPREGEDVLVAGSDVDNFECILQTLRQQARDNLITVWGKRGDTDNDIHEEIEPNYWQDYGIDLVLAGHMMPVKSWATRAMNNELIYYRLMTSRSQIEAAWPQPKKRLSWRLPWHFTANA